MGISTFIKEDKIILHCSCFHATPSWQTIDTSILQDTTGELVFGIRTSASIYMYIGVYLYVLDNSKLREYADLCINTGSCLRRRHKSCIQSSDKVFFLLCFFLILLPYASYMVERFCFFHVNVYRQKL